MTDQSNTQAALEAISRLLTEAMSLTVKLAAQPTTVPMAQAEPRPDIDEDDLLPCPFCGSENVSLSQGSSANGAPWFYIECEDCSAFAETDSWNKRAAPSPVALQDDEACRAEPSEWATTAARIQRVLHGPVALQDGDACRAEPSDWAPPSDYDGDGSVAAMAARAAGKPVALQGRDERALFEAWALRQPWIKDVQRHARRQDYGHYETRKARAAWQAARASLPAGGVVASQDIKAKARTLFGWVSGLGGFEDAVTELLLYAQGSTAPFTSSPPSETQGRRQMTAKEKQAAWVAATIELPSPENCYLRGIADAEAHHGIPASPQDGGEAA